MLDVFNFDKILRFVCITIAVSILSGFYLFKVLIISFPHIFVGLNVEINVYFTQILSYFYFDFRLLLNHMAIKHDKESGSPIFFLVQYSTYKRYNYLSFYLERGIRRKLTLLVFSAAVANNRCVIEINGERDYGWEIMCI